MENKEIQKGNTLQEDDLLYDEEMAQMVLELRESINNGIEEASALLDRINTYLLKIEEDELL